MKSISFETSLLFIFATLFISACATRLDTLSPIDTDLSGRWVLNQQASQTVTLSAGRESQQGGGMGGGGMGGGMGGEQQDSDNSRAQGDPNTAERGLTPAMKSIEMTIEQNHDSMGIAYPDELYRDIDWGEKKFYRETVNAGWQENTLLVISTSEQMTLTETYQLNPAKDVLTQTLTIKSQRGNNEFVRVFNLK